MKPNGGILRRQYLRLLLNKKDSVDIVKVITGMRRCGKSTLLRQYRDCLVSDGIDPGDIIYLEFDGLVDDDFLDAKKLFGYLKRETEGRRTYLLLDEIQNVDRWELLLRSLMKECDTDICITGSNAHMLSSELATSLSGRAVEISMLPLSFGEYLELNGVTDGYDRQLTTYIQRGAMPILSNAYSDRDANDILEGIYNTVIVNDIVNRGKDTVRNGPALERLVRFLFSACGSIVSPNSISKQLGYRESKTVDYYLGLLEEAFIVYRADRYDLKGNRIFQNLCKYYCTDTGMRNAVLKSKKGTDIGHLLENVVYLELRRRGYRVFVGIMGKTEVDFVAENESGRLYFQVTESMLSGDVRERELRPLKLIRDNYPKAVISADTVNIGDFDGIRHINVVDFLLGKDGV